MILRTQKENIPCFGMSLDHSTIQALEQMALHGAFNYSSVHQSGPLFHSLSGWSEVLCIQASYSLVMIQIYEISLTHLGRFLRSSEDTDILDGSEFPLPPIYPSFNWLQLLPPSEGPRQLFSLVHPFRDKLLLLLFCFS